MTADLRDLYQEVIVDHSRRPHNFGRLVHSSHRAEGSNPLCGDQLTVYLQLRGDIIDAVTFEGTGCAISTASASMMTDAVKGKSVAEVETLFAEFRALVTGTSAGTATLGKLAVLAGVREYPLRVKCATLAWHTLHAALCTAADPVTTE